MPPSLSNFPDLGTLGHELNNALAPIILSVELLRRRIADPDTQRQLDLMAGHAWRGAALARRLLARAEAKPRPPGRARGGRTRLK